MTDAKVNLRGMIRLDDVEDLLTEVLHRLDAQDGAISRLNALIDTMMPMKVAKESYADLKAGVDRLAQEVDVVRGDILVKIDGRRIPVSTVVSGNYEYIARVKQHLPLLIERGEVELQLKALSAEWMAANQATRQWAAPNDTVCKLGAAHTETVRRLNGIEALTACKLDRSEVGYLEGLANNFEAFGTFQKGAISSIEALERVAQQHTSQIAEAKSCTDALKAASESAFLKLTTVTPKAETRALAMELEKQRSIMKRFCDVDTVDNLNTQLLSSAERLRITEELLKQHQLAIDGVEAMLPSKADAKDLAQFVKHERVDEVERLLVLKGEREVILKNKAIAEEKFQKLDEDYADLRTRLGVALRFVDWFTHRGETYEHNMKLIDKHLHGLATTASDPKNKQVFDSAIRYTSLPLDYAKPSPL